MVSTKQCSANPARLLQLRKAMQTIDVGGPGQHLSQRDFMRSDRCRVTMVAASSCCSPAC